MSGLTLDGISELKRRDQISGENGDRENPISDDYTYRMRESCILAATGEG